jgi:hypothetical protein
MITRDATDNFLIQKLETLDMKDTSIMRLQRFFDVPDFDQDCLEKILWECWSARDLAEAVKILKKNNDFLAQNRVIRSIYFLFEGEIFWRAGNLSQANICFCEAYRETARSSKFFIEVVDRYGRLVIQNESKSEWSLQYCQILEESVCYTRIKNLLKENEINQQNHLIVILEHRNVGDSVGFLSMIKPLGISLNQSVILIAQDCYPIRALVRLFGSSLFKFFLVSNVSEFSDKFLRLAPIDQGQIVSLHLDRRFNNHHSCSRMNVTKWDQFRIACDLAPEFHRDEPELSEDIVASAKMLFRSLCLYEGKTVLLAPMSNFINRKFGSNVGLRAFWCDLYEGLVQKGYHVIENISQSDEKKIPITPAKGVEISLEECIPFVQMCGNFIGIRSGLCDLLTYCSCERRVVVFPEKASNKDLSLLGFTVFEYANRKGKVDQILELF